MGNKKSKPVSLNRGTEVNRRVTPTRRTPTIHLDTSSMSTGPTTITHPDRSLLFCYVASGGGKVEVPKLILPYDELGLTMTATNGEIKEAFKQRANRAQRQQRVMASLAYHMITSQSSDQRYSQNGGYYQISKVDVFTLAVIGYTSRLLTEISRDNSLLDSVDCWGRTVLYLAARCGFYDTTEALLKAGAAVNKPQAGGSTSLHGAAFYGQAEIVKLLLVYGADTDVKNDWGNTPEQEAASDAIKQILVNHKSDIIAVVATSLISNGLAVQVRLIEYEGKVIGKEILRSEDALDPETRHNWNDVHAHWEVAWHGTKAEYLESIARSGLLPSGTKLHDGRIIKPPSNHYQLSEVHFGVADWARAIFVSPNLLYASHVCYSERVISECEQWCVLVKARVKPSSYTSHDPTTLVKKDPIDGEPDTAEYRVPVQSELDTIMRVETDGNVVTSSILFIKLDFLERAGDNELTYDELQSVFA